MRLCGPIVLAVAVTILAGANTGPARAGGGVGELSLDREAIRGLLEAALPPPTALSLPGLPDLVVRFEGPRRLELVDGGVEAVLGVVLEGAGHRAALRVRYVPEVERPEGIVTLRPDSAIPDVPLPVTIDVRALLPSVALPRSMSFTMAGSPGGSLELTCMVQGVEVQDERVVVQFGLMSRRLPLLESGGSP
jgi:hypothetical protein